MRARACAGRSGCDHGDRGRPTRGRDNMRSSRLTAIVLLATAVVLAPAGPAHAGKTVKTKVDLPEYDAGALILYGQLASKKAVCTQNRKIKLMDPEGNNDPINAVGKGPSFTFDLMPAAAESVIKVSERKAGKTKCAAAKAPVSITPSITDTVSMSVDNETRTFSGSIESEALVCKEARQVELVFDPPLPDPVFGTTDGDGNWALIDQETDPWSGTVYSSFAPLGFITEEGKEFILGTCGGGTSSAVEFAFE